MNTKTPSTRGIFFCVLLLAILSSTCSLFAQGSGSIKGRVIDCESGEPLVGAIIMIQNTSLGVAADIEGKFHLSTVPADTWTVKVSYLGYITTTREATVTAGVALELEFRLKPQAIQGEEVVVTAPYCTQVLIGVSWWKPAVMRRGSRSLFDEEGNVLPVKILFDKFTSCRL